MPVLPMPMIIALLLLGLLLHPVLTRGTHAIRNSKNIKPARPCTEKNTGKYAINTMLRPQMPTPLRRTAMGSKSHTS